MKPISEHYNHVFYPVLSHTAGCHVTLHQEGEAVQPEFFSSGEFLVHILPPDIARTCLSHGLILTND